MDADHPSIGVNLPRRITEIGAVLGLLVLVVFLAIVGVIVYQMRK